MDRSTCMSVLAAAILLFFGSPSPGRAPSPPTPTDTAPKTQRRYLSGTNRDDAVPWDFFCTANRNSGRWTTISVPSCWDMQGFGNLAYYDDDAKLVAEQGKYRHTFTTPPEWGWRRISLVFDGVMTDAEVTVNGKTAGPIHQGSFYRFKYDVTALLRPAGEENLLEVTVSKRSANASVNRAERKADYWVFGGIFRPVYLEAAPQEHIDRVAIDARADGAFAIDVFGTADATADGAQVTVLDSAGAAVGVARGELAKASGGAIAHLAAKFDNVAQWTAETPNLYTARIELKARDGRTLHEFTQRFGFRTIEVRAGDGIYVNGRRVMLKGVCRHASDPDSGRTMSPALDRADIDLIKQMNMNAVRMSHYPPDESFLELCDEQGLYVLDELAGWQKSYDADVGARLVGEMIARDVNHPSILFWDNGNEGGWNTAIDGEFAKWDPQARHVLHPWGLHGDIDTKHYPNFALFTERLAGKNVFMPTEFLHGLYDGGGGAGLRDYWEAMRASRVGAGGFLWVFADEGIRRGDDGGRMDVVGNSAPDGLVGPYREKEASFYTVKKVWSPVQFPDALPAGFDGRLHVSNQYDFSSLDRVKFSWQLRRWHGMDDAEAGHQVMARGVALPSTIAAGTSGELALDLPKAWRDIGADGLAVTATGSGGREIWTWVYPLGNDALATTAMLALPTAAPAVASSLTTELRSGEVLMTVEAKTGVIRALTVAGAALPFTNGPRLAIAAPPKPGANNADHGPPPPMRAPVATTGTLTHATWTAGRDGWFRLDYEFDASGPCDYLGVTFDLPEEGVKSARWLGSGPQRVWKNRMDGPTLGVWENGYNDSVTGWSGWAYPEFKGYFADLHWAKLATDRGTITIAPETPGLFLRVLTPRLPPDRLARSAFASFPEGGLSLMNAIPAIGTKFSSAIQNDPHGAPFDASGSFRGVVWFRFAKPADR